jgi:hypothetical protein
MVTYKYKGLIGIVGHWLIKNNGHVENGKPNRWLRKEWGKITPRKVSNSPLATIRGLKPGHLRHAPDH